MAARRPQTTGFVRSRAGSRGQATTEFILLIGLIAIPIAVAYNLLAEVVRDYLVEVCKLLYGPGL